MSKQVIYNHYKSGLPIGSMIAVLLSWSANHSVLWAILHGIFGWFYVLYHVCKFYL